MRLLRKNTEQDAATVRELDAVDQALVGERVPPDLAEFARLASELREDRPIARSEFLGELDRAAGAGFPPAVERRDGEIAGDGDAAGDGGTQGGHPRVTWPQLRRVLAPASAVAASMAIATVAVVSSGVLKGADGGGRTTVSDAPTPAAEKAAALPGEQPIDSRLGGSRSDGVRPREVERSAVLALAAPGSEIEDVADGVIRVTDRYRGYVVTSSVSSGDGAQSGATLELRIPSARVQDALADLSELAHVRERSQSTADITADFVSVRTRIGRAQRERASLLRQLSAADTANETASVKARLRASERFLARLRAQLKALDARVTYSSVNVTVARDEGTGDDGKFTPADALDDARAILGAAVGAVLIGLAVLIPAGLLLGLVWLCTRGVRRRMREQALDAADRAAPGPGPDGR